MNDNQKSKNMSEYQIENMRDSDWEDVRGIYQEGIQTGNATFESDVPSWDKWNSDHLTEPRLLARLNGTIVGWAGLSPVSERCVYGGVAEVSVYIATSASGQGIGTLLLKTLVSRSEEKGIWTLQAGIFHENEASITIHHKCGFRTLGVREKLGKMNGIWRDVVFLERRSDVVGVD